ncbi:MAG: hypothetical protein EZS28_037287, partial [Streblomastix strix]
MQLQWKPPSANITVVVVLLPTLPRLQIVLRDSPVLLRFQRKELRLRAIGDLLNIKIQ